MAVRPSWTDNVIVQASAALAFGAVLRSTLTLTSKYGAELFLRVGRTAATAPASAPIIVVRRLVNGTVIPHPVDRLIRGNTVTAIASTVASDAAAAATTLVLTSGAGFAAEDIIVIGPGTAREEFARVAKVATNTLTLDRPLAFAHTATQADPVVSKCDVIPPLWLIGGAVYEITFDYAASTSGADLRCSAFAQTYDTDVVV